MDALIDLIQRTEFRAGLIAGAVGVVLTLMVGIGWRTRPVRIWGVVFTAAAWTAVWVSIGRRLSLGLGLALLVLAGLMWSKSRPASATTAVAGASIAAWRGGLTDILWIRLGVVVAILLIGMGILRFARQSQLSGLTVPLFAITVFGIWATVPDTEAARIPLGVMAVMGLVAWPWRFASIGDAGAFALAGMIVWVAALGGEAREGSIIGAWASAGVLLTGLLPHVAPRLGRWAVLALQGVVVFWTARIAGFRDDAIPAFVLALPVVIAGIWVMSRDWTPDRS